MSTDTKISWCHHTFNPWWGCTKVNEACTHCYAEALSKRTGRATWGVGGTRVKTSPSNWNGPRQWNEAAAAADERRRVFCASMADWAEQFAGAVCSHQRLDDGGFARLWWRSDIGTCTAGQCTVGSVRNERPATLDDLRRELFGLVDATPSLDWLLLTKRPENIRGMWPGPPGPAGPELPRYRRNVWRGYSVGLQSHVAGIAHLVATNDLSPVAFLSCEPLLGPVDLLAAFEPTDHDWDEFYAQYDHDAWTCDLCGGEGVREYNDAPDEWGEDCPSQVNHLIPCRGCAEVARDKHRAIREMLFKRAIQWVIVGCESRGPFVGRNAEHVNAHIAELVMQCELAGVPVHVKQIAGDNGRVIHDFDQFPKNLRVRELPRRTPRTTP